MEIKSDEAVLEDITEEYNTDPEANWKVTAVKDARGRYNLYVIKGKKFWQIKTEFITPHKSIGVGGKTTAKDQESEFTFGLRPLPSKYVKKIIKEAKKGNISQKLLKEIMKIPPVPTSEVPEKTRVLQGPVSFSLSGEISRSQRELDKKLSSELDRLIFKEQVGSIYR